MFQPCLYKDVKSCVLPSTLLACVIYRGVVLWKLSTKNKSFRRFEYIVLTYRSTAWDLYTKTFHIYLWILDITLRKCSSKSLVFFYFKLHIKVAESVPRLIDIAIEIRRTFRVWNGGIVVSWSGSIHDIAKTNRLLAGYTRIDRCPESSNTMSRYRITCRNKISRKSSIVINHDRCTLRWPR